MKTESNSTDDSGPRAEGADVIRDQRQATASSQLDEDQALAELQRSEVTAQEIAAMSKGAVAGKSRKVATAIVMHARTPRHISIPLLRRMFTFDLMHISRTPKVAEDIKHSAEDQILLRAESLSVGEKISLAKRASGRVAAGLLVESDSRVISPALDNPQLSEVLVTQALLRARAPEVLFVLVSDHRKWSQRREVQIALLRSEKTPIHKAKEFAKNFSKDFLREILPDGIPAELL